MARETLKDFLRSGRYPTAGGEKDIIQYTLDSLVVESDRDRSGLSKDYNTGAQLIGFDSSNPEEGLVGNFLHYITRESGNLYEFKKGNQETYAGKRGESLQDQDKFLASPPYVPQGTVEDSLLEQNSNSGYFNDPSTSSDELTNIIIDKVSGRVPEGMRADPNGRGANDLLKGVKTTNDYVVRQSVNALKRNNRFGVEDDSKFLKPAPDGILGDKGVEKSEDFRFVREDNDYYTSIEKLKNAGASLLLRASGYDVSISPQNDENFVKDLESKILDSISAELNEKTVQMPGQIPGQEKPKIFRQGLEGMNASGVPTIGGTGSSVRAGTGVETPVLEAGSSNYGSFGVTYNQALRFEENTPTHRVKTALRMIALYTLLETLYNDIIACLEKEDQQVITEDIKKLASTGTSAGALALGLSRKSNKFITKNFLFDNFLTPTDFPYGDCFRQGVKVLLGKDVKNVSDVKDNLQNIYNSPGFWLAVSNTAIKKTFFFSDKIQRLESVSEGLGVTIREILGNFEGVAKIANIFAIIGEKSLHFTNSIRASDPENKRSNPRDVDSYDNIPGNRVGKSRKKSGKTSGGLTSSGDLGGETALSWGQSDIPSAYLLPLNIMRAVADLNNTYTRENPARGMLGSRLVRNTYTGLDTDGTAARIPNRVVKILEDRLEAEYVPFYIQDLRTNEIISFHAFLNELSDTITPTYSSTSGYGRLDSVQTYQSTTRSISLSFTLFSTNREDFDDMWYKINKFVTLLYPQWTQGSIVQTGDPDDVTISGVGGARFVQPFSQTIGASPIIRLRVGDVIKSNYSRFALARTFGIGDQGVKVQPVGYKTLLGTTFGEVLRKFRDVGITIFATVFGSPQGLIQIASDAAGASIDNSIGGISANAALDVGASYLSKILINGFVNPLLATQTINRLRDPNSFKFSEGFNGLGKDLMFVYLNPNMIDGYQSEGLGERIFTTKRVLAKVIDGPDKDSPQIKFGDETGKKQVYKVKILDQTDSAISDKIVFVKHEDIWNDPSETFTKSVAGLIYTGVSADLVSIVDFFAGISSKRGGDLAPVTDLASDVASLFFENLESAFMRPELNPYVRAFNTTKGRGLAGVINGGVSFNWLEDFPWETDFNARAPIGCKISFSFDVIHDIPPGLDHTGYNRAPLYNVGEVMRNVAGDVYEDKFSNGERIFRAGGSTSASPGKTNRKTGS